MEIQPTVTINPATGEEVISYDHAVVKDTSYIDDVQRQHRELEQQVYYEDENGLHNAWADAIPDEQEDEPQYQQPSYQEVEEDDDSGFSSGDELAEYIQDSHGDSYRAMLEWALENVDEEFIQRYDAIMDTNDPSMMIDAINTLAEFYNKHS